MSDWKDLQDLFSLSDSATDELLDIVNWVTASWLQDVYGYAKDTPQSVTIETRFLDESFKTLFDKAVSESDITLERGDVSLLKKNGHFFET